MINPMGRTDPWGVTSPGSLPKVAATSLFLHLRVLDLRRPWRNGS